MRIVQTHPRRKNNAASRRIIQWAAALFLLLSLTGCAADSGKESEGNDVLDLMGKGSSALLHEVYLKPFGVGTPGGFLE